jgi:hypothetical protein
LDGHSYLKGRRQGLLVGARVVGKDHGRLFHGKLVSGPAPGALVLIVKEEVLHTVTLRFVVIVELSREGLQGKRRRRTQRWDLAKLGLELLDLKKGNK